MLSRYQPTTAQTLSRWAYTLFTALLIPLMFVHLLVRITLRSRRYGAKHFERFGHYPEPNKPGGILVHCVSVGEVMAATPLVRQLQQQQPDMPVTMTCTTATGAAQIERTFGDSVFQLYLPYDLPLMMGALLRKVKPRKVLITEVELWPNMLHVCWKKQLPVYLFNARMTDRSAHRWGKLSALFYPMLAKLSGIGAQGQRDYHNYLQLGMDKERLQLNGNIKFDLADAHQHQPAINALRERLAWPSRPVLLAGSTHAPEEQTLLSAYGQLKENHPQLLLVLVPRHPQRFEQVAELLEKSGLNFQRSSAGKAISQNTQVLLVDEMGQLTALYGLATMAFVGGSIAERGGHNALEAAVFGLPVMMGPHRYNNPEICQALTDCGALHPVANADDIAALCRQWLEQPVEATELGGKGLAVVESNRGALKKTLAMLSL